VSIVFSYQVISTESFRAIEAAFGIGTDKQTFRDKIIVEGEMLVWSDIVRPDFNLSWTEKPDEFPDPRLSRILRNQKACHSGERDAWDIQRFQVSCTFLSHLMV
jgi:hypothetical protein